MKYFAIAIRPSWGGDPSDFSDTYNIVQGNDYGLVLSKTQEEIASRGGKYTGMIMNTQRWGRVMVDYHGDVVEHFYKHPGEDEIWKGTSTMPGWAASGGALVPVEIDISDMEREIANISQ